MSHLTGAQIAEFRAELERQLAKLEKSMTITDEALKTVELDQGAVGRLSRMDSLQNQSQAKGLRERESVKLGKPFRGIADDAMEELCAYAWPGNVRELRNVVERAAVLCQDDVLRLPAPLSPGPPMNVATETLPLMERLRQHKIRLITEALEASGGNQRRAAEYLGLHRPSLSRMIRDLGIDVPRRSP